MGECAVKLPCIPCVIWVIYRLAEALSWWCVQGFWLFNVCLGRDTHRNIYVTPSPLTSTSVYRWCSPAGDGAFPPCVAKPVALRTEKPLTYGGLSMDQRGLFIRSRPRLLLRLLLRPLLRLRVRLRLRLLLLLFDLDRRPPDRDLDLLRPRPCVCPLFRPGERERDRERLGWLNSRDRERPR